MNSRNQLAQSLYQARLAFDAMELHLDHAETLARATLARVKLARRSIDAWRISVVHEACNSMANGNDSEGGGSPPPPDELTS